jgi:hypothetical protein
VPRHVARHVVQLVADYFASCRLVVDYFAYASCPGAWARRVARLAARRRLLRLRRAARHVARHAACRRLLRLCHASGCLGTSRGSSRDSSRRSSSTTSPTPCIRVPQHVARLVTRLVVDYFDYAARPGASARYAARRRLLHVRWASGCLGTSHDTSRGSSLTTSPCAGSSSTISPTPRVRVPRHIARLVSRLVVGYFAYIVRHITWLITPLVVEYFAYAARPGASVRRAACHAARRRLLRLAQAHCRLLRLRRGSSSITSPRAGSLSTTSPTPRIQVLQHIAQLVIDYFTYAACPGASARRAARHASHRQLLRLAQARRRLLCLRRASGCLVRTMSGSRTGGRSLPCVMSE